MNLAAVAELADALASGASGSNAIRVRLSSAAQTVLSIKYIVLSA